MKNNLKKEVNMKETENLEFKKSTSELRDAIISISSVLNKHGKGKLVFGIDNKGNVLGQEISEKTLRDLSQKISTSIEPKVFPKIYEERIENKNCIIVEFSGENAPYYAFGRSYIRVADEDKQMSAKELEKFILSKNKDSIRWDYEICKEANLKDIDVERLKWFLRESEKDFDSVDKSLRKLKMNGDNGLLNSAVILFGKAPQEFFQNAKLRCAVFGGEDTSVDIDMQEFEGNLFYLIESAEKYFLKNIHIGMKLDGLKRIDVPEINKGAFREAIINAFCHRDYFNPDAVHLAIFKDRVEIRSPGLLFGGLTIEKIRMEKVSERRNERIAQIFHLIHFVENWGKGISKILSLEPKTEFSEVGRKFYTVFKRKGEVGEKVGEKVGENLTKNQAKIINFMKKNEFVSIIELSKRVGIATKNIEKNIEKLKKLDLIKRIGGAKGGHWKVNEK